MESSGTTATMRPGARLLLSCLAAGVLLVLGQLLRPAPAKMWLPDVLLPSMWGFVDAAAEGGNEKVGKVVYGQDGVPALRVAYDGHGTCTLADGRFELYDSMWVDPDADRDPNAPAAMGRRMQVQMGGSAPGMYPDDPYSYSCSPESSYVVQDTPVNGAFGAIADIWYLVHKVDEYYSTQVGESVMWYEPTKVYAHYRLGMHTQMNADWHTLGSDGPTFSVVISDFKTKDGSDDPEHYGGIAPDLLAHELTHGYNAYRVWRGPWGEVMSDIGGEAFEAWLKGKADFIRGPETCRLASCTVAEVEEPELDMKGPIVGDLVATAEKEAHAGALLLGRIFYHSIQPVEGLVPPEGWVTCPTKMYKVWIEASKAWIAGKPVLSESGGTLTSPQWVELYNHKYFAEILVETARAMLIPRQASFIEESLRAINAYSQKLAPSTSTSLIHAGSTPSTMRSISWWPL